MVIIAHTPTMPWNADQGGYILFLWVGGYECRLLTKVSTDHLVKWDLKVRSSNPEIIVL